ncbi:reverse transcriptase [Gossypium australe]|uniref:Reverse transcriptase n=1 Tax=Gossypium australe TaxID=47621 RepID=A0A5B6V855_9ROSI|nr:reverse transcriptase [Gossypium australe]
MAELGPTKAPGEDGFPAIFYQKCWAIIGEDVTNYCLHRLNGGMNINLINKTNIVLIPKIAKPSDITQYRPISLCNVIYKLLAKVLANRLCLVMNKCIDLPQSAFVPERLISDNVLLAYELLHILKHKRVGKKGFMAVKLDMSKAYDRVEWNFVEEIMKKLGFDPEWVALLMKCVTTVSYSVVLNGNNGKIFSPSRGLRQGDPLSPFLFLFCGEGLSSLMKLGIRDKLLRGVKASRSGHQISHLLFVDDCILFGEATERGAVGLKRILYEYKICSGQRVNFSKSAIFFSTNSEEEVRRTIIRVLGVRSSNDPERYLGLPNKVGRKKKATFQILKDRLRQRIDNWSIKYLSQGGKEVFIKAVLQSIPTYSMACFLLPKSLCSELEIIIAKFWWRNNKGKKGIHWYAWKDICVPKEFGGLDFRNLDKFNIALLAKQGWRLITYSNSLLACVLKAKYYPNGNFLDAALGNVPSLTWRSIWSAKGILEKGLCWRVSRGDGISVWTDLWVLGNGADRLQNHRRNGNIRLVADLIGESNRTWKRNLIVNTFDATIARKILQIPLAKSVYEDFQVWRGEPSGNFSINSHISELEGVEDRRLSLDATTRFSHAEQRANVAIYFDAAYDQQTFRSASGLVVYDVRGRILASKAVLHSNVASPFAVEAHARLQAVKLGEQMGFTVLDIICDSKTVIMKCQTGNRDSSNVGALIRDIQATKSNFQEIKFWFIPRTENTCADLIAREMLYKREEFYLEREIPNFIRR